MRRAFFAWERGLKGPSPVVFYDGIPPLNGKPTPTLSAVEVEGGTSNVAFFYHDETPNFRALAAAMPAPATRDQDQ